MLETFIWESNPFQKGDDLLNFVTKAVVLDAFKRDIIWQYEQGKRA